MMLKRFWKTIKKIYAYIMWLPYHKQMKKEVERLRQAQIDKLAAEQRLAAPHAKQIIVQVTKYKQPIIDNEQDYLDWVEQTKKEDNSK